MNIFGVGPAELLLVALLALVFIGPERLPEMMRKVGKMAGDLRRMSDALTAEFKDELGPLQEITNELTGKAQNQPEGAGKEQKPAVTAPPALPVSTAPPEGLASRQDAKAPASSTTADTAKEAHSLTELTASTSGVQQEAAKVVATGVAPGAVQSIDARSAADPVVADSVLGTEASAPPAPVMATEPMEVNAVEVEQVSDTDLVTQPEPAPEPAAATATEDADTQANISESPVLGDSAETQPAHDRAEAPSIVVQEPADLFVPAATPSEAAPIQSTTTDRAE